MGSIADPALTKSGPVGAREKDVEGAATPGSSPYYWDIMYAARIIHVYERGMPATHAEAIADIQT